MKRKRTKEEQRRVRREHPPGGIERRIETRHELESACTLTVLEMGSAWKCRTLEISLSGCRLFSETPFEVLAESRVEVEFVGKGQPFRLAASAKIKGDEHLLGMHFMPMSQRCKDRLLELIGELAKPSKDPWLCEIR